MPSAEQATEIHPDFGAVVCVQVAPELVETQMPPPVADATSLPPSADDAMEVQFVAGAEVCVQVCADADDTQTKISADRKHERTAFIGKF